MKKINSILFLLFLVISLKSNAQQDTLSLGQTIDLLVNSWDEEAVMLESYTGLRQFCKDINYRTRIITLLQDIHHQDSVLYERAKIASKKTKDHEVFKLIEEIESFEKEYTMKEFIHFLHIECDAQSDLERHKKELKTEVAEESYDSKVYVLEVELRKYIHHITKRVDNIQVHVHHLHIK